MNVRDASLYLGSLTNACALEHSVALKVSPPLLKASIQDSQMAHRCDMSEKATHADVASMETYAYTDPVTPTKRGCL